MNRGQASWRALHLTEFPSKVSGLAAIREKATPMLRAWPRVYWGSPVTGSSTNFGALRVPVKLNRPFKVPALVSEDPLPIAGKLQLLSMNWVIEDWSVI